MQNFFRLKKRQGGYTNCYLEYPVGEGYRVPTIDEFVQGFEFEIAKDLEFLILDFSDNTKSKSLGKFRIWEPAKVWWKGDLKNRIIFTDDEGFNWNLPSPNIFCKPFDEQSMIDQKLVRVKIKNDEKTT